MDRVFDPVMASVQVCVGKAGGRIELRSITSAWTEEGETVTLKPLLPKKFETPA